MAFFVSLRDSGVSIDRFEFKFEEEFLLGLFFGVRVIIDVKFVSN